MDVYAVDTAHLLLLETKLLTPDDILLGDYEVTSINRRNKNLQITTNNNKNYLVKQVSDKTAENAKTLRTELTFYQSIRENFPELQDYFPKVFYTDEHEIILIMEFYKDAIPLWKYYKEKGIDKMPLNTIAQAGNLLATIHKQFKEYDKFRLPFLSGELPFAFTLHKPHPKILSYIRKGGYDLIENLQQDEVLFTIINSLEDKWEINALIHGDIKLDNVIVIPDEKNLEPTLKLIDWEMVQYGDIAWDIAGALQDFIFWWIIMMPGGDTPEEMIQNATFPFVKLQPAINIYWEAYAATAKLNHQESEKLLNKAIQFSGLRCLQTAYEIATKFEQIPPVALILLNTGKSILKDTEMAKEKLYGIMPNTVAL